jgi:hypothetical protein
MLLNVSMDPPPNRCRHERVINQLAMSFTATCLHVILCHCSILEGCNSSGGSRR